VPRSGAPRPDGATGAASREALAAALAFVPSGRILSAAPLRVGHIHDTFVVIGEDRGAARRYLLQRLNRTAFPDPRPVLANIERVTRHLRSSLAAEGVGDLERRVLRLIPTRTGGTFWTDAGGACWRAYGFVEGAASRERLASRGAARLVAHAFGEFARRLASLPPPPLHVTIAGFHDTPARLAALARAAEADSLGRARRARVAIDALLARQGAAGVLTGASTRGELPLRVVHNDTKVNNVLLDRASGAPLCVVDLDTVMPGLPAHDFGDLVRSATGQACEGSGGKVEPGLLEALARGYLEGWAGELSAQEVASLAVGPQVITLELAARFLTDHLEGDRYFKTRRPGENLERCRGQIALLEQLETHAQTLARLVERAARG
jgi:hypothetical protein